MERSIFVWGVLDVFVDAGCGLRHEPWYPRMHPMSVDVTDATSLERLCEGGILVVGTRVSNGAASLAAIRGLRETLPHVLVVLFTTWREAGCVPSARWTRAGVDEFVTSSGQVGLTDVVRVAERRALAPPPMQEPRLLRNSMPASRELAVVLHCMRNASGALRVADLERRFGYSARNLRHLLCQTGFPGARDICRVARFLHGAELIDRGILAPADLALRLGFADSTEMRKAKSRLRRSIVRATQGELREFASLFPRLQRLLG